MCRVCRQRKNINPADLSAAFYCYTQSDISLQNLKLDFHHYPPESISETKGVYIAQGKTADVRGKPLLSRPTSENPPPSLLCPLPTPPRSLEKLTFVHQFPLLN